GFSRQSGIPLALSGDQYRLREASALEPAAEGRIEPRRGLLVELEVVRRQEVAPAPVRPLEEEALGPAFEDHLHAPLALRFVAHRVELRAPDELGPEFLVDLDAEEVGDAPHLAVEIGLHVRVMDEQDVR